MTSKQKQKHPSIFYPCVKLDTIQNPPTQQHHNKTKKTVPKNTSSKTRNPVRR